MTRFLHIILFFLCSAPAYAEWVVFEKNRQIELTVYVDPDTIRRKGNLVKIWELFDFKTAQTEEGLSHLSAKVQVEYDCAEERHRLVTLIQYSDNMGRGNVIYSDSTEYIWEPVAPDTIGQRMWKFACKK